MTTYVYETIPSAPGEKPRYYEIKQNMNDLPLFTHPDTGEQIRRVVLGGLGVLKKGETGDAGGPCCGQSGCC